jgi:hypothetical protein
MFCAGLLSIGHFLLQVKQPENQKHRNRQKMTGRTCPVGENGVTRTSQYDTA